MKEIWISESKEETWSLDTGRTVLLSLLCSKSTGWDKKGWAVVRTPVAGLGVLGFAVSIVRFIPGEGKYRATIISEVECSLQLTGEEGMASVHPGAFRVLLSLHRDTSSSLPNV